MSTFSSPDEIGEQGDADIDASGPMCGAATFCSSIGKKNDRTPVAPEERIGENRNEHARHTGGGSRGMREPGISRSFRLNYSCGKFSKLYFLSSSGAYSLREAF